MTGLSSNRPPAPLREWFLLLFAAALLIGTAGHAKRRHATLHQKRAALRAKLHSIHDRKVAVRAQLDAARARKATYAEQLADTREQLSDTRRHIETAGARLRDTQRDLGQAQRDLTEVRTRLDARNALLAKRLVATQRHGAISYAAVVFQAANYWDFLSRRRLMGKLVRYDIDLVKGIKEDEAGVLNLQARLVQRRGEEKQLVAYLDGQRARREVLRHEQADEVVKASREAAEYERQLSELEQNSSQITSFLQKLQETPAGRARAAVPFHGGLSFPVAARITSPFGMRFHPILHRWKLHTGIDFGVGIGTPIHAAGNGVVVHAGWWGAYGNAVIIDHGGCTTTLYGHMSRVLCHTGEVVQRGRVVGLVGSTGWSTGPHCHFEVRKNGVPVNPLGGM